jgi:hypothetical protein
MAKSSVEQAKRQEQLARALGAHQQGKLGGAERLYAAILAEEPENFEHHFGLVTDLQKYADEQLGLDCNGFVGNFLLHAWGTTGRLDRSVPRREEQPAGGTGPAA